jgi:Ca-activated chloride channel family protein
MNTLQKQCYITLVGMVITISMGTVTLPLTLSKQAQSIQQEKIVKLSVLVTDSQNRPINDVKQEEFQVFEDGVPQTISFFSKEEPPLNYCIVMDTSASRSKVMGQMIDVAKLILHNNKPGDEISLIEFKGQPDLLKKFTSNKENIIGSLDDLSNRGGSIEIALVDAVYLATKYVAEYKPVNHISRRAIILITHGVDHSSYYNLGELRKLLRKENVQIFAIGFDLKELGQTREKYMQRRSIELLSNITKETGGQAFFPESYAELQNVSNALLSTLRTQYIIGYKPAYNGKKGSYRTVNVTVADAPGRDKRLAITRAGYVYDSSR